MIEGATFMIKPYHGLWKKGIVFFIILLFFGSIQGISNEHNDMIDQGVDSDVFDGYLLIAPMYSRNSFLIDSRHHIVHFWYSKFSQALGTYLLDDGTLLRTTRTNEYPGWLTGGYHGRIEQLDWNSNLLWEFQYINETHCIHNDIEPLPNGNILMISWERKSYQQAIDAGRDPSKVDKEIWVDSIIEVKPCGMGCGEIVWEWNVWDHLIQDIDPEKANYGMIQDHSELIDINNPIPVGFIIPDIIHLNSLDYHEEWDQILVSSRNLNEIFVIDHSTTIEEAAGHTGGRYGKGGDLLYRWGNPQNYEQGNATDQQLFAQHDVEWIPVGYPGEGHITVYDNGWGRPDADFSSAVELVPPVDEKGYYQRQSGLAFGPKKPLWRYIPPFASRLQSLVCGSVIVCKNGHKFIGTGTQGGFILELNSNDNIIWWHLNSFPLYSPRANAIFKIRYYPSDYPWLKSLDVYN